MFILYNIHIYSGSWRKSSVKLRCILLFLKLNSMYSFDLKFEYINWLLIHRTIYHYYAVSFVRWKFPFLCKEDIRFRNTWNSQSRKLTIMLLLWFVLILSVKKRWLAMYNRILYHCIDVSIPAPLRFGYLCNWEMRQPWRWM